MPGAKYRIAGRSRLDNRVPVVGHSVVCFFLNITITPSHKYRNGGIPEHWRTIKQKNTEHRVLSQNHHPLVRGPAKDKKFHSIYPSISDWSTYTIHPEEVRDL